MLFVEILKTLSTEQLYYLSFAALFVLIFAWAKCFSK